MLKKILIIIVILFCAPLVAHSESPSNFSFSKFLNCFQEKSLPITIEKENYGDEYAKKIHDHYVKKYFGICCPETKGLDLIKSNYRFLIVTYKTIWTGTTISLATFSQSGELLDSKVIAKYLGDSAGGVISNCRVNRDLTFNIEIRHYKLNEGSKVKDVKGLVTANKKVWRINQRGKIID